MSNKGISVLLGMLGGNEETVTAINNSLNKKILNAVIKDNKLIMHFKDGTQLTIWDDGQSCCENRYMSTDDELPYYTNTLFKNIYLKEAPNVEDEYGEHEVQFLEIETAKGSFIIQTHNEHNGYYGGFWIKATLN